MVYAIKKPWTSEAEFLLFGLATTTGTLIAFTTPNFFNIFGFSADPLKISFQACAVWWSFIATLALSFESYRTPLILKQKAYYREQKYHLQENIRKFNNRRIGKQIGLLFLLRSDLKRLEKDFASCKNFRNTVRSVNKLGIVITTVAFYLFMISVG